MNVLVNDDHHTSLVCLCLKLIQWWTMECCSRSFR